MTHKFADQQFSRDDNDETIITFTCTCGAVIGPLHADPVAAAWLAHVNS